MKEIDLFDLIESYLDNVLPEDKRREVEHRMAQDKAFRQEVELHRELQENFSYPGRWRLRSALVKVMEESLPAEPSFDSQQARSKNVWKWTALLAVVLMVGFVIWQWHQPFIMPLVPVPDEKQPTESPAPPASEGLKTFPEKAPSKPKPSEKKLKEYVPVAEADPANFVLHEGMEDNITGVRGGEWTVNITSPAVGADFKPGKHGKTQVVFRGTVEDAPEDALPNLEIRIFNNRDARNALLSQTVKTNRETSGAVTFELRLTLDWQQGLYYLNVRQKEKGEELGWGKFTIGKPVK